jgi:transposase InsO family protein
MDERTKFVGLVNSGVLSVAEICRRFEISRKTGYKWLRRFAEDGALGLRERSRAPKRRPWSLPQEMQDKLLELRRQRPTWGPRKMLAWLAAREPELELPAASTVGDLFKREGLTGPHRRRRFPQRATPTGLVVPRAPNDCWPVDFKGNFVVEHQRCHPLTVTDAFSRFLIGCEALKAPQTALAKPVFRRLFDEYGLPKAIRSDNGAPFASTGLGGLSVLSVWWIRLGIRLERIPPGQPQHNGRHERMHRTLKAEAIKPPAASFAAQQRRFDTFRIDYNSERPHEALNNETPAALYTPSARSMPRVLPELEYPSHFELRAIRRDGMMKLRSKELYVSVALNEEVVGLEEIDDGIWRLYFGPIYLAIVNARGKRLGLVPAPDETTLSMTE